MRLVEDSLLSAPEAWGFGFDDDGRRLLKNLYHTLQFTSATITTEIAYINFPGHLSLGDESLRNWHQITQT